MTRTAFLASCAALSLLSNQGLAQEIIELDEIIVSGGLAPIPADQYGRAYTVLTSEEIERRGHRTVTDALRAVPGFNVSVGGLSEFRVRGSEANHTLILVDGIEVQLTGSGAYELGNISVEDIERIEVLRGPQSAIYGSSASSGVLSIITKGAEGPAGVSARLSLEAGTDETLGFGLNLANRGERGFVALNFAGRSTDGYDISVDDGGAPDARDSTAIGLRGEYRVTDWLTAGAILRRQERSEGYDNLAFPFGPGDAKADYVVDGDNTRVDEETNAAFYLIADTLGGRLRHELRFSRLDAEQVFETGFGDFASESGRDQTRYTLSYGIDGPVDTANHLVIGLLEREIEEFENSSGTFDRRVDAMAVEYRGTFENGLSLQAGLRRDDNEAFEDATTWNAAIAYQFAGTDTRLRASAGIGIVNPTFFEQFGFTGTFAGNPDLEPERLDGWDIGISHGFLGGRAVVDLTYFDQRITDRIGSETVGGVTRPINLDGESTQRGVELAGTFQATPDLRFDLAYTYLDAEDPDGTKSIRRPENTLDLAATWTTFGGRGDITAAIRHVAGNTGLDRRTFQDVALDDYTIVNLGVSYDITDSAEIYARIENAFETEYEEQWGYTQPGRSIFIGARTTF